MNLIDPDGNAANPVYDFDGNFRGTTIEGFTGEVIIYGGEKDFSDMTAPDLLFDDTFNIEAQHGEARTYDSVRGELSGSAKSKIWTHIASQMEGQQVYDEVFSLSSLSDRIISYSSSDLGSWISIMRENRITGTDKYTYETTVENIQSSVIVHEWYSHIMKKNGDRLKSHRLAYKNVINHKTLWNKTTDSYKRFYLKQLLRYTIQETNRVSVDPPYRRLFEEYVNKR